MIKVRIGSEKKLHTGFSDTYDVFDWIRSIKTNWVREFEQPCIFSVLVYEHGSLETMDRYYFNGIGFVKENILA